MNGTGTACLPESDATLEKSTISGDSMPANGVNAPPVRVLHVINGEHYSGAERVQDLLAGTLPQFGYWVEFACVKPGKFAELRQNTHVPAWQLPMRSRWDVRAAGRLAQLVRQGRFELLHAHTPRSLLVAAIAAWRLKTRLVYHVHSPAMRDSVRRWQNRFNAWVERVGLLGASGVIAVSHSVAGQMAKWGLRRPKLCVVPNGVPIRPLRRWSQPAGRPWVLGTVALFRPRKGLETLLEAIARLRGQGRRVLLRAVGPFESAEHERHISGLVRQLNIQSQIEWTGFTRDVEAELGRMDLFVLPSLFGEGLPMVVLEAMAVGLPAVATRVEGIPEAIRHEQDGLIVEPGNSLALAAAIDRVVSGRVDAQQMRTSAWHRQRELFSDKSMAAGVAALYDRVLGRAGRS